MPATKTKLSPQQQAAIELEIRRRRSGMDVSDRHAAFQVRYYNDPAGFARDCIDWQDSKGLAPYQEEPLSKLPKQKRISIRGPHGLGKTALAAIVVLWFALTRDGTDWKVVSTAGAWRQLSKYLWPEIHKWVRRLRWDMIGRPPFQSSVELLDLSLKLRTGEAFAVASDNPDLIEGAHADHLLYLFDEAKAIPIDTWDAAEGAFATDDCMAIAFSTPGEPNGRFYDIHRRAPGYSDWWVRKVTKEEAISAGRMDKKWADARRKQWGEKSAVYQNRVEGEFASSDEDGIIPLADIERAIERWKIINDGAEENPDIWGPLDRLGVDIGRGGDPSVIGRRHGWAIKSFEEINERDVMVVAGRTRGILAANREADAAIDVIGIGAGVVDRLREAPQGSDESDVRGQVLGFNASENTDARDNSRELGFVNCVTDTARVLPVGNLKRIYRSRHQGPLYRVKTSSGDEFTATPNHQVLTLRGWVAVQSLHVGDKLCNPSVGNPANVTAVRPEINDVIPAIGEVYRAADRLFGAKRVKAHAVNFHGDRPVDEVDVVTVNSDLHSTYPSNRQHLEDYALVRSLLSKRDMLAPGFFSESFGVHNRNRRIGTTVPDLSMFTGSDLSLSQRQSVQREVIGYSNAAGNDVVIAQQTGNGRFIDAVSNAQGFGRFPFLVSLDDIASIQFGGHAKSNRFMLTPFGNVTLSQNAPDDVQVNRVLFSERMNRLTGQVGFYNLPIVQGNSQRSQSIQTAAWLDLVFPQDTLNDIGTDPKTTAKRIERFASQIATNDVISIDLIENVHDSFFVYTLQTTTGAYYTSNAVHRNCRAWAWWTVRELLQDDILALPPDDTMIGDLTAPKYKIMSGGRIQVESKDDIKKRIGRSTNYGDAVVMAFWKRTGGPKADELERFARAELGSNLPADLLAYMRQSGVNMDKLKQGGGK